MANNRLYIGDSLSKEYIFIEKGWGAGWDGSWFDDKLFYEFISTRYDEGQAGQSTNMFFFTEFDERFSDIINNWSKFESHEKHRQKELLTEMMRGDEELGLYDNEKESKQ